METYKITIYGVVQGVGFRPFIYNLASNFALNGYVKNVGNSLQIVVQSDNATNITSFISSILPNAPKNAEIRDIITKRFYTKAIYADFSIKKSSKNPANRINSAIPKDLAICKDCANELESSLDRRFNYAFINCTNCGPRYSIIKNLPYDRANTAMDKFAMCEKCQSEYDNPHNRRFHAQPNSCHQCGISLFLFDKNGTQIKVESVESIESRVDSVESMDSFLDSTSIINHARKLILNGAILSLKGVGGFNLVCALDSIPRLRELKNRPSKPFAIMFANLTALKRYFRLNAQEITILTSCESPILLLNKSKAKIKLPENIAPNLATIGVILAYSPLLKMLFSNLTIPLVFTSANLSGEPLVRDKNEAFNKLDFDFLLDFNREINNPIDDSVVVIAHKKPILLRAARGYYPLNLKIPLFSDKVVLALGANQKSQIALFYQNKVAISPFIGDLENVESINRFCATIDLFLSLYNLAVDVVLCDKHPHYESSKIALKIAQKYSAKIVRIYHHRAHLYSCLFDNWTKNNFAKDSMILDSKIPQNLSQKILGVIFDGTGFGEDGAIWGGEFFINFQTKNDNQKNSAQFRRIAHFKYFPLLGANNAIRDIKKVALGVLFSVYGDEIPRDLRDKFENIEIYRQMFKNNINSPQTSSIGRIFDSVAYLCGALVSQSFEGQSGMILEALYDEKITQIYPFRLESSAAAWDFGDFGSSNLDSSILDSNNLDLALKCVDSAILDSILKDSFVISLDSMFREIVEKPLPKHVVASKFINTLVCIITILARFYNAKVAFSGGVFQNRILCDRIIKTFKKHKIEFLMHENLPPNDGGIAFGQVCAYMQDDY